MALLNRAGDVASEGAADGDAVAWIELGWAADDDDALGRGVREAGDEPVVVDLHIGDFFGVEEGGAVAHTGDDDVQLGGLGGEAVERAGIEVEGAHNALGDGGPLRREAAGDGDVGAVRFDLGELEDDGDTDLAMVTGVESGEAVGEQDAEIGAGGLLGGNDGAGGEPEGITAWLIEV